MQTFIPLLMRARILRSRRRLRNRVIADQIVELIEPPQVIRLYAAWSVHIPETSFRNRLPVDLAARPMQQVPPTSPSSRDRYCRADKG